MSPALVKHTGDTFAMPPSAQSRAQVPHEAAHRRYTYAVAHKKPDAAAGCAGRPSTSAASRGVSVCERVSRSGAVLMHARPPT